MGWGGGKRARVEEVMKWGGGGREGCTLNSRSVGHFLWRMWPNAPQNVRFLWHTGPQKVLIWWGPQTFLWCMPTYAPQKPHISVTHV